MLLNLHVRNYALIEEADIDFGSGLNILTGETGAGKSLLIDAVNAALGGRLRGDVIRSGCDSAYTELVFSVPEPEKQEALAAMDISTEYECIVISRKILPSRSIHKINDETVTSAKVRQVTSLLLDIHGQHEHQSLMRKDKHLEVLDQFGGQGIEEQKKKMAAAFEAFQKASKALAAYSADPEERRRELDFLEYEIAEIEETAMRPGETEELSLRYKRMSNSRRLEENLGEADVFLYSGEPSASDLVSRASGELFAAARLDDSLSSLTEEFSQIEDLLNGFRRELETVREDLQFDPAEFQEVTERLDQLHKLESKYGDSYERIQEALKKKKNRLEELTDWEDRKRRAETAAAEAEAVCLREAEILSSMRAEAVPGLEKRLGEAIRELNFTYVDFSVFMEKLPEPGRNGGDSVEFRISLNPGEAARPLGSVASGGELSRIMLAIKAVLADKDEIPTLIFDEIDTGISGRTAQKVSEKLSLIGRHRQVICITHLPQIAAMADHHYGIRKAAEGSHTITRVDALSEQESVDELARLLGGAAITETVYQNAMEIKRLAGRLKEGATT